MPYNLSEVLEEKGETHGRPDYTLRINGQTKFFFEAKRPSALPLQKDDILQTKRYAWSGRIYFAGICDFEQFRFFDSSLRPDEKRPLDGEAFHLIYNEYASKIDPIWELSRDRVATGSVASSPRLNSFNSASPDARKISQKWWRARKFCPKLGLLMDNFSQKERSNIMRPVRSTGTRPELTVRSIVRQIGIRYRACVQSLPGKPDIVVYPKRKVILVHGCFWHAHSCDAGELPKSNRNYWKRKQRRNAVRDLANARALRSKGWKLMVLWECEIRSGKRLERKISRFLRSAA